METVILLLYCTFYVIDGATVSNSSVLTGRIENGNTSASIYIPLVVSFRKHEEHLCTGCHIARNFIITSDVCSNNLCITILQGDRLETVRDTEVTAYFGNENREIDEIHNSRNPVFNCSLFDVALVKIKSDNITREHIVNIKISGIHIAPDMEMEMFGWGVSEIKILGQYVYSFGVTKIDVIYLPFTECKKQFDNYFLDDKVNACARTKNEHQKISLLDAGSPILFGNEVVGVVSHVLGRSRNYILFVPSFYIVQSHKSHVYRHIH